MRGGKHMQRRTTDKGLPVEFHDGTIPAEGQPVERIIRQIAQHLGLIQIDAERDEHFKFAGGNVLGRQPGKSQILPIEFRDREGIVVRLLCSRERLREFSRTMGKLADTDRRVVQVRVLIGIEAPKPMPGDSAIELYEVMHFMSASGPLLEKLKQHPEFPGNSFVSPSFAHDGCESLSRAASLPSHQVANQFSVRSGEVNYDMLYKLQFSGLNCD